MNSAVTALYDCRSKQEYIYRTNRIREISGASNLLASIYYMFVKLAVSEYNMKIKADWKHSKFSLNDFEKSDYDAEVIYVGGGNLYMIYKSMDKYIFANKILSRMLIDETYSISIIASCVKSSNDFNADRKALYIENKRRKNLGTFSVPCNTLPFVQVDRVTYLPIVCKDGKKSYSRESIIKDKFTELGKKFDYNDEFSDLLSKKSQDNSLQESSLDNMVTQKGTESLLAVIYIDGNDMGSKVKDITKNCTDYDNCVKALRDFSMKTDIDFVQSPINAIDKLFAKINSTASYKHGYRLVIGGGDEITLICNARDALKVVQCYFENLTSQSKNSACAGIAIFHSHAPFADIYEIAEQCCESGKKKAHLEVGDKKNYIDFHFCHAGITNDLETVRLIQENNITKRPYEFSSSFRDFSEMGKQLQKIGRSNVKTLSEAIVKGDSYYKFEINRINTLKKTAHIDGNDENIKRMIYDVSLVYDIWFSGSDK